MRRSPWLGRTARNLYQQMYVANYGRGSVMNYIKDEDHSVRAGGGRQVHPPRVLRRVRHPEEHVRNAGRAPPGAFRQGIALDGSAVPGFGAMEGGATSSCTPDPKRYVPLPWRPEHGRVVQMFSDVTHPDGSPFVGDTRIFCKARIAEAESRGLSVSFGAEQEFYLFELDENGPAYEDPLRSGGVHGYCSRGPRRERPSRGLPHP